MEHIHPVIDSDTHFKIDGVTRSVKNVSDTKSMLVQYDHNSERFTFDVPRLVDEHDLSLCNLVRVHYSNIDKVKRTENKGVVDITDSLAVCTEDDNCVTCSWLVPKDATLLVGSLHFVIQFACKDGDEILYSWNTAKHTSVVIAEGIDGGEAIVSDNIDILTKWEEQLKANHITKIEQTTFSTEDNGENVWTATFGDGRTQELKVRNGSRGDTGLVGSIETREGNQLDFSVCSTEEYNALTEEEQANLIAFILDGETSVLKRNVLFNNTVLLSEIGHSFDLISSDQSLLNRELEICTSDGLIRKVKFTNTGNEGAISIIVDIAVSGMGEFRTVSFGVLKLIVFSDSQNRLEASYTKSGDAVLQNLSITKICEIIEEVI